MIKLQHITITTSLLIAGCAAYFSVYGIGLLFSGATIAAMIMASSLELGKLVSTSWLFKNWYKVNWFMKIYMTIAVFVLMGITSLGIFGFLTAAFQKSALENELSTSKIVTLESQKTEEGKKIENVKQSIDKLFALRSSQEVRLTETLTNTLIARNPIQLQNIQNQINDQIEGINKQLYDENVKLKTSGDRISKLDDDIFKLKVDSSQKKDITTFKFVADEFHTKIQTVVKWFIIVLITVFDPLAVVLLLAYNISDKQTASSSEESRVAEVKEVVKEVPVEKIVEVPVEKIVEVPKEIIKEVVKEVPVEKIVEVPKEVPRKRRTGNGMFHF